MSALDSILAKAAQAVASGADQTVAKTGGGDYTPPAAGSCKLRFVEYIEIGKQSETFLGKPRDRDKVMLTFEVSGPNHPAHVAEDGTKHPIRITITETLSLNEKARYFKLFNRMNYAGTAKHMAQLLGQAFLATIIHREYKRTDGTPGVAVELYDKTNQSYTIRAPRNQERDAEGMDIAGKFINIQVDAPISPIKGFFWDFPDIEAWNALFIDGEYPERKDKEGKVTAPAKSKNVVQAKIKLAKNFAGSQTALLLAGNGIALDIPDAESGRAPEDEGAEPEAEGATPTATAQAPTGQAATDHLATLGM